MSMIGEYVRLTPAELERTVEDPHWALAFIEELIDVGIDEPGGSQPRCLDIDMAWDALRRSGARCSRPAARDGDAMVVWLD